MIRRFIRSCRNLRNFPRHLFEVLSGTSRAVATLSGQVSGVSHDVATLNGVVSAVSSDVAILNGVVNSIVRDVADLSQMRRENFLRHSATLSDVQSEISGFCTDATRMLLALDKSTTTIAARLDTIARVAHRTEERLDQQIGRLDHLEGRLDAVEASVGKLSDVVYRLDSAVSILGGETFDAVAAELRRQATAIEGLHRSVALQSMVFPSWIWTCDAAERIRSILSPLTPQAAKDVAKIRIGRDFDGGYVMLNAFQDIDAVLSLGISDDVSWDIDVADRGIKVLQYDPTVPSSPEEHSLFSFEPLRIADNDSDGSITLDTILETRLPDSDDRLLLKMDIEGAEWDVLAALPEATLRRFRQIVCEFHTLERLAEAEFGDRAQAVFTALARTHFVCHVHGNNCSNFVNVANIMLPQSLEVTFASREHFTPCGPADEVFPTALDRANEKGRADLFLGNFRFEPSATTSA